MYVPYNVFTFQSIALCHTPPGNKVKVTALDLPLGLQDVAGM